MRHVMGPFGDEEDAEFGDVVDGQVVDRGPVIEEYHPNPNSGPININRAQGQQDGVLPPEVADHILKLATDQRSKAIALFVEVPFLAYVALSPRLPALVRLGAAALGLMRAVEVAQRQQELEQYLPEMP